jgi:opacity protein-like surface antigen
MKKTFVVLLVFLVSAAANAAWEDWDLGGELGLGIGAGSEKGKIMSPALTVTGTREEGNKRIELGLGFMYGTDQIENFTKADLGDDRNSAEYRPGETVDAKLTVMPFTVNILYTIYENFYVGGGVGLYNVFYKEIPGGDYRVNPDSKVGAEVKSPASTALGFQQLAGVEIFPMSPNWSWFVGIKSFLTTSSPQVASILGITIGGKVKYSW